MGHIARLCIHRVMPDGEKSRLQMSVRFERHAMRENDLPSFSSLHMQPVPSKLYGKGVL